MANGTDAAAEDPSEVLLPDLASSFDTARSVVSRLHDFVTKLKAVKQNGDGLEGFGPVAREMQLQLLALRRAHRAMGRAADAGKASEMATRKAVDAAHSNLETRCYESACLRAASRRCRNMPTPELTKLRPHLAGFSGTATNEDDPDDDLAGAGSGQKGSDGQPRPAGGLAGQLEVEHQARLALASELEGLEQERARELESLRKWERCSNDLTTHLKAVELAMEPVANTLLLRPRPEGAPPLPNEALLASLPTPLRLIFHKFDNLLAFDKSPGLAVSVEGVAARSEEHPPEKRPKTEAAPAVVVKLPAQAAPSAVSIRFTFQQGLVFVAAEGMTGGPLASGNLLEGLWTGDEGRAVPPPAGGKQSQEQTHTGQCFAWAQLLGGLREAVAGNELSLDSIAAGDVLQRLRARLAAGSGGSGAGS